MTCLSAYMYRQISKCTDKFPNTPTKLRKSLWGGGSCPPPPPPSGYANGGCSITGPSQLTGTQTSKAVFDILLSEMRSKVRSNAIKSALKWQFFYLRVFKEGGGGGGVEGPLQISTPNGLIAAKFGTHLRNCAKITS